MLQDQLADVLSAIKNAEKIGQKEIVTRASKEIRAVLEILLQDGYIVGFEFIDNGKSGRFKIELKGKVIDCNVIKPRHAVAVKEFEKWEKRYLPGREFGILILTTPKGFINHKKAKEMNVGGKLVAFCY
jgi:small subunit ribosomal protein S8